ncbi:MAG TPA: hypothetical protein P5275_10580 [Saprospiraceae bacterium]|nr:hypothetical protein [Saprospiraceae bacterium]
MRLIRLHIISIFYLYAVASNAQGVFRSFAGPGPLALTVLPVTGDGATFLPGSAALLSQYTNSGISLGTTWPYTLANVLQAHAALVRPLQNNNFLGFQLGGQGDEALSEFFLGAAYAKKLSDKWSAGIQAGLLNTSILNWASVWNFSVEASTLFLINEELQIGYRANFYTQSISLEERPAQWDHQLGIRFHPTNALVLGAEIVSSTLEDWHYHLYLTYQVQEHLGIRFGQGFSPYQFGVGIDLNIWDGWMIQLAARYHPVLRWSPGIGLQIPLKKGSK